MTILSLLAALLAQSASTPGNVRISANPTYQCSNAGCVTRPLSGKDGDVTSVKDFGAIGDGVHDDAPNIQACVNAVNAAGGGTCFLPAGTYLLVTQQGAYKRFIKPLSGVSIVGVGPTSILKAGTNTCNTSANPGGCYIIGQTPDDITANVPTTINNVLYADFTSDLNGANNVVPGSPVGIINPTINIFAGDNIAVERLTIQNNAGQQDIVFGCQLACTPKTAPTNVRIINNYMHNTGTAAPGGVNQTDHSNVYTYAQAPYIAGNRITNDTFGIGVGSGIENHSSNAVVVGNTFTNINHPLNIIATVNDQVGSVYAHNTGIGCTGAGIQLWQNTGFALSNIKIHDNYIEMGDARTAIIDTANVVSTNTSPQQILIEGNTFNNVDNSRPTATGAAMSLNAPQGGDWTIVGNTISNFYGPALTAASTSAADTLAISFIGNSVRNVGRTSVAANQQAINLNGANRIRYVNITGNTFSNPSSNSPATSVITSNDTALAGTVFANAYENFTAPLNISAVWTVPYTYLSPLAAGDANPDFTIDTVSTRTGGAEFLVRNNGVNKLILSNVGNAFFVIPDLSLGTGMSNDAAGFKHRRGTAGCATAAAVGATCTTTVTWGTAFPDTNYTVKCGGVLVSSGVPLDGGNTAKIAASVTFQTVAATAAAAQFTAIDCIAVHD